METLTKNTRYIIESAEQDVTVTMLTFHHQVTQAKGKGGLLPATFQQKDSNDTIASNNTNITCNLQTLFRKYRDKIHLIDTRIQKWDLETTDRDSDALLVAKLNNFDASTAKVFDKLQESKHKPIKLGKKLRQKLKNSTKRHLSTYILPQQQTMHRTKYHRQTSSISSSDSGDSLITEAPKGKRMKKISQPINLNIWQDNYLHIRLTHYQTHVQTQKNLVHIPNLMKVRTGKQRNKSIIKHILPIPVHNTVQHCTYKTGSIPSTSAKRLKSHARMSLTS